MIDHVNTKKSFPYAMRINVAHHISSVHNDVSFSHSNPGKGKFSISFWLQVLSPHSAVQTVFRTGSTSWDTGVSLRLQNSATKIIARLITHDKHLYTGIIDTYDTLTTWSHFAINANYEGIF